ncbi:MAG: hypothetical protein F6K55_30745 [Moorea sp. SIO4A3]|nr:hypothetical protein [Moorena sp. SIO4A3]
MRETTAVAHGGNHASAVMGGTPKTALAPQDRNGAFCVNFCPLLPVACSLFPTTAAKSSHHVLEIWDTMTWSF